MQVRTTSFHTTWRTWSRRILVLGALVAGSTSVQQAQAQAPTIGVVDGVKINDGFTKLKTALAEIDNRKQQLRSQLDARSFMAETDAKRFDELIVKATRSEAENQEIAKLVQSGNDRAAEYKNLVGKATKTDADKARIQAIEADAQKTGPAFQGLVQKLDDAITKPEMETEDDYRGRIIKVVEQVAGEKKLVLVVGKQAIAWNSATIEITDEVLSRLNKS